MPIRVLQLQHATHDPLSTFGVAAGVALEQRQGIDERLPCRMDEGPAGNIAVVARVVELDSQHLFRRVVERIEVFPNPVRKVVSLQSSVVSRGEWMAEIYSIDGVLIDELILQSNSTIITFKVDHLHSGIYIFRILEKDQVVGIGKFVKVH